MMHYTATRTLCACFLIFPWFAQASKDETWAPPEAGEIRARVSEAMPIELPAISTVLPGYERPAQEPPSLAIGYLQNNGQAGAPWGWIIGHLLRWHLKFCTQNALRVPGHIQPVLDHDFGKGKIQGKLGVSEESLLCNYRWLGIENLIRGGVAIGESTFELKLALHSMPDFATREVLQYTGSLDDLIPTINEIVGRTYSTLGCPLDSTATEYLKTFVPDNGKDLKSKYEFMTKSWNGEIDGDWSEQFWKTCEDTYCHPFDVMEFLNRYTGEGENARPMFDENVRRLNALFPKDTGIPLYVFRYYGEENNWRDASKRAQWTRQTLANTPNDDLAYYHLADDLIRAGSFPEALSVSLEMIERWPRHYNGWNILTKSLYKYAWDLRGNDFWHEVPTLGREYFPKLMSLADSTANIGLGIREDQVFLWYYKMVIEGSRDGMGREYLRRFTKAVELCPSCHWLYQDATVYLLPQWGGSFEDLARVIDTAIENTPEGSWPRELFLTATRRRFQQHEEYPGLFNPKVLSELAFQCIEPANMAAGDDDLYSFVYDILGFYVKGGAYAEGTEYLKNAKEYYTTEEPLTGWVPSFFNFVLAEYAIAFEDPDLALSLLEEYEPLPELQSCNYRRPALQAVARILKNPSLKNFQELKKLIEADPEDIYAKSWVLELGIDHDFDAEFYYRCLADVVTWATEESVKLPMNAYDQVDQGKGHKDLQFAMKHLGLAHKATRDGKTLEALELYRRALGAQQKDSNFMNRNEPLVIAPMYRLIRKTYPQS